MSSSAATAPAISQDIALLGVDNNPAICEASKPTRSSIQVDFENDGFLAAKMLGEALAAKSAKGNSAFFAAENISIAICRTGYFAQYIPLSP